MVLIDLGFNIKKSPIHGWGLFSKNLIPKNTIALQAPATIIPEKDYCPDALIRYTFTAQEKTMISFHYISYINSSNTPNVIYSYDDENKIIILTTLSEIKSGDEITLKYL